MQVAALRPITRILSFAVNLDYYILFIEVCLVNLKGYRNIIVVIKDCRSIFVVGFKRFESSSVDNLCRCTVLNNSVRCNIINNVNSVCVCKLNAFVTRTVGCSKAYVSSCVCRDIEFCSRSLSVLGICNILCRNYNVLKAIGIDFACAGFLRVGILEEVNACNVVACLNCYFYLVLVGIVAECYCVYYLFPEVNMLAIRYFKL